MYVKTLKISQNGQITLPKKIRQLLDAGLVSIQVDKNNNVILTPVHDVAGALSAYQQPKDLPFEKIREKAWRDASKNTSYLT